MTNTISYGHIIDPNDSTKKIDGVRLDITDSKVIIEIPKEIHAIKFEILNGYFIGHDNVTFVGCTLNHFSSGSGGRITKYKVEYMFTGICINSLDELKFSQACINIPSLADFCKKTLIKRSHINNEMTVKIEEPQEIKIADIDNFSLSISIGSEIHGEFNILNIQETFKLRITAIDNQIFLLDFLKIIERFQSFLLIALNYSPNIKDIVFYRDDYFYHNNEERVYVPIKLFTNLHNVDYDKNLFFKEIEHPNIQNDLSDMVFHWYNNKDLHISIDLLTEKIYNKELSRESYFLNSCFAIEIFHRRLYGGSEYQDDIFKEKLEDLYNNIEDKKFASLVKSKLQFANEYSFRRRLKFFKEDFAKILPEKYKVNVYISKIVNTRNFLVHRSSDNNTFKEIDLFYASKYIESVLRINFLRIINCPENIVNESFTYAKNNLDQLYNLNNHLQTKINKTSSK